MGNVYTDPTTGEWVAEHETRDSDGEVRRDTQWFRTEGEAWRFARTGKRASPEGEARPASDAG